MSAQAKAPERIWFTDGMSGPRFIPPAGLSTAYIRADLAAEQVREAYGRGLDDAARVAEVKPRKGGRPLSGPHHAGIRSGRSEAARLIRALKSDDTNGGQP